LPEIVSVISICDSCWSLFLAFPTCKSDNSLEPFPYLSSVDLNLTNYDLIHFAHSIGSWKRYIIEQRTL